MKRILLSSLFTLMIVTVATAQKASAGKIEYQKGEKQAAIIELPYSPDIVEGAIRKRLETATIKEERQKGMQVFKGARVTPTDGESVDFYFKVDRKGTKEDSASIVYLVLGRPGENVGLRLANDDYRIKDAAKFLDDFVPVAARYKLDHDIAREEEAIKKAEKNMAALTNDQQLMEQRIRELQERLAQNKRDQQTETAELTKHRSTRDALVAKRATQVAGK